MLGKGLTPPQFQFARWIPALICTAVILALTLSADLPSTQTIRVELCTICGDRALADFIVNLALFVPLGLALAFAGATPTRCWQLPFLLSIFIELAQLFIPGRFSTLSDIVSNTAGGAIGASLPALWLWWSQPAVANGRLWIASVAASLALVATAWLTAADSSMEANYAHWRPEFENLARWQGEVIDVRIDGKHTTQGWLSDTSTLVRALAAGSTLTLDLLPGVQTGGLAPIYALTDSAERVRVELSSLKGTLLFRQRSRASTWRLASAADRFEEAADQLTPNIPHRIEIATVAFKRCLSVDGASALCVPPPSVGSAWQLLYAPDHWSVSSRRLLDYVTLVLIILPAALVAPHATRSGTLLAVGLVAATLALAPLLGSLHPVRSSEIIALVLTWVVAWRLRAESATRARLPATRDSD